MSYNEGMARARELTKSSIPRGIQDVINNTIHTSNIDGNAYPISLCYEVVRQVLEYQERQAKSIGS